MQDRSGRPPSQPRLPAVSTGAQHDSIDDQNDHNLSRVLAQADSRLLRRFSSPRNTSILAGDDVTSFERLAQLQKAANRARMEQITQSLREEEKPRPRAPLRVPRSAPAQIKQPLPPEEPVTQSRPQSGTPRPTLRSDEQMRMWATMMDVFAHLDTLRQRLYQIRLAREQSVIHDRAATIIQSHFRVFRARHQLRQLAWASAVLKRRCKGLALRIQCNRYAESAEALLDFLYEIRRSAEMARAVKQYRFSVIQLQHAFRGFILAREPRTELMTLSLCQQQEKFFFNKIFNEREAERKKLEAMSTDRSLSVQERRKAALAAQQPVIVTQKDVNEACMPEPVLRCVAAVEVERRRKTLVGQHWTPMVNESELAALFDQAQSLLEAHTEEEVLVSVRSQTSEEHREVETKRTETKMDLLSILRATQQTDQPAPAAQPAQRPRQRARTASAARTKSAQSARSSGQRTTTRARR